MGNSSNFDPQHENYYTRLGLEENVSPEDIKRAFFNAVKIYPPEKDPENCKLIREAYDTLFHSISRTEYDTKKKFGSVLENLENNLQDVEEDKDIDEQIRILKKILNMAPKLGIYRNKLGNAFMEKEQYGYAKAQYVKAHNQDLENPVYILNMGYAESERPYGNYQEAENLFRKAWDLDKDDYSPPRALASLYYEKLDQKRKAHAVLDEAIEADGVLDFKDFFCIYDKIHFYALAHNKSGLARELKRVKSVASKKEEKDFAAFMLYRTGGQLYELNIFDLSIQFLETAHSLLPEDSEIERFYNECKKQSKLVKSIKKINDSDSVHEMVKALVGLYAARYYGEIDQQEFVTQMEKFKAVLTNVMDTEPDSTEVKESFKYIRQYHKDVYNLNSGFFDILLDFPSATSVGHSCPHCGDHVRVAKYDYGNYECPHCYKSISYGSGGYTKAGGGYTSGSSDWCFIATAVYEDYNHPQVLTLREFRDKIMSTKSWSRNLIEIYYKNSPPIAGFLKNHRFLSGFTRVMLLNPIIQFIRKIMKYTEWQSNEQKKGE